MYKKHLKAIELNYLENTKFFERALLTRLSGHYPNAPLPTTLIFSYFSILAAFCQRASKSLVSKQRFLYPYGTKEGTN